MKDDGHSGSDARVAAVGGYAAEVMRRDPDSVSGITRFEAGNRHAVYGVSFVGDGSGGPDQVVVRVSYGAEPEECARGQWESDVLTLVSGVAGPVVYDFRCSSRWFATPVMCIQFLSGDPLDPKGLDLDQINELGSVVRFVHGRPIADLAPPESAASNLSSYAESRLAAILSYRVWIREPVPAPLQARINRVSLRSSEPSPGRPANRSRSTPTNRSFCSTATSRRATSCGVRSRADRLGVCADRRSER